MLLLVKQKIKYLNQFPADLLQAVWIIQLKFGNSYKKDKSINKLVSYLEIKKVLMMIGYVMLLGVTMLGQVKILLHQSAKINLLEFGKQFNLNNSQEKGEVNKKFNGKLHSRKNYKNQFGNVVGLPLGFYQQ